MHAHVLWQELSPGSYPSCESKGLDNTNNFQGWLISHFSPEVENFCKNKNISFKAILLDNSAGSPAAILEELKNIKVVYLPPIYNLLSSSLLSRCIIQQKTFSNAISATHTLWPLESFYIKSAVQNIGKAWNDINEKGSNWKKLPKILLKWERQKVLEKN